MYEVIVTFRPDFAEQVVHRCANLEEAHAVAGQLWAQHREKVIRVWVRQKRAANTKL